MEYLDIFSEDWEQSFLTNAIDHTES